MKTDLLIAIGMFSACMVVVSVLLCRWQRADRERQRYEFHKRRFPR